MSNVFRTHEVKPITTKDPEVALDVARDLDARTSVVDVAPSQIEVIDRQTVRLDDRQIWFSDAGFMGFNRMLQIPNEFARRVPFDGYEACVNSIAKARACDDKPFRAILREQEQGLPICVGVASSTKYAPLGDAPALEATLHSLGSDLDADSFRADFTDKVTRVRMLRGEVDDWKTQLGAIRERFGQHHMFTDEDDFGDAGFMFRRGVTMVNSANGLYAFGLEATLFRLVCSNGMVLGVNLGGMKRRHVGDIDWAELTQTALGGIASVQIDYDALLDNVTELQFARVRRDLAVAASAEFADKLLAQAKRRLEGLHKLSRFALVQAISDNHALGVLAPDARLNVERIAGGLLAGRS